MSAENKSKQVLDTFWEKNYFISSRSNRKGIYYAMEGYIKDFKIHTEGEKLKIRRYSGLPNSLIHIAHFLLSRCGLGKGTKYTPFCSLSG